MPFKKDLAERLYRISKFSSQSLTSCRITSSSVQTRIQKRSSEASISPDPGDHGMFRRLFHRKAIFQPEILPMQIGEKLKDKLKAFDVTKDRIRLDRFFPPEMWKADKEGLTIEGTRKLLRVAQLELMKSRLRQMDKTWITYSEFVQTIGEVCSDPEQAKGVANTLDESGSVLVIGDVVYLKPEKENETLLFRSRSKGP